MRRAIRVTIAVVLAYLIQSTILPSFKVGGVMINLMVITLFTCGYAAGLYTGLTAGVFGALLMEVASGDLQGLTAVACIAPGVIGAWLAKRLRGFSLPGKRTAEQYIKRFAPVIVIALIVTGIELLYFAYFYLTGMDVGFSHFLRCVWTGILAGLCALVLMPLLYNFMLRKANDTLWAKWARKRKAKRAAKKVAPPKDEPDTTVSEGGTEPI